MLELHGAASELRANANFLLGLILNRQGDVGRAKELFRETLDLVRLGAEPYFEARALQQLAGVAESDGAIAEDEQNFRLAIASFRPSGERYGLTSALYGLSRLLESHGDLDGAQELCLEGLRAAKEIASELRVAEGQVLLGNLRYASEHYEEAEAYYRECLAGIEGHNDEPFQIARRHCQVGLGETRLALHQYSEAFNHFHRAIEGALSAGHGPILARGLHGAAAVLAACGRVEEPAALLRHCLELSEGNTAVEGRARSLLQQLRQPPPELNAAPVAGPNTERSGAELAMRLEEWQKHVTHGSLIE